jgi:hypothetical protein
MHDSLLRTLPKNITPNESTIVLLRNQVQRPASPEHDVHASQQPADDPAAVQRSGTLPRALTGSMLCMITVLVDFLHKIGVFLKNQCCDLYIFLPK